MSSLSAVRCWPQGFLTDMPPPGRRMGIKVVLVSTHQINSSTAPTDEPRAPTLIKACGKVTDKSKQKTVKKTGEDLTLTNITLAKNKKGKTQQTSACRYRDWFLPRGLFKALAPVRRTPTFYSVWLCRAAGRLPRATPIFLQIFFNNNLGGQPHGPHILCVHTIWLDFVIGRSLV